MPSLDSKSENSITINIDNKADTVSGKLELGKNSFAQTANELQEQGEQEDQIDWNKICLIRLLFLKYYFHRYSVAQVEVALL